MIASAGYVQALLAREGLRPNKNLGQNFFIDGERLQRLLSPVELEGRPVLEIGPGLGALTEVLLSRGARVWAVEKDPRMAALLREALGNHPALTILEGDCLKTDYGFLPPGYVAAGNLPYCITTPIVEMLLIMEPEEMLLMMQKEAAERFTARPGDRVYGPLTVLAGYYYEVTKLMELSRDMYYPQPDVDSVVLKLTAKGAEKLSELEWLLNRAFAMRRKTLSNNLRAAGISDERLKSLLGACGIEGNIRAEKLTVAQFANIAREIEAHGK
jgi:16S rRNA (adenine1518-N6/adenine1519-N6)-dimethyltransferase